MVENYDRQKAVEYARTWAMDKNPYFGYFGGLGGDCTNYISQCLLAGGGVMNYDYLKGWFYESMVSRSPSWTSVAYLQKFSLRKDDGVGPFAKIVSLDELQIGDIIQLRQNPTHFNHTVIVSKILNDSIYVCAHSNDAIDKPLKDYNYQALLPIHIIGIKNNT